MGLSRDDYTKFQKDYQDKKIFANDPFAVLDQEGVGQLVKMAVELGRKTNLDLEIGICGEHGGESSSVQFCYRVGMNYVSCSPTASPSPVWPPRKPPFQAISPKPCAPRNSPVGAVHARPLPQPRPIWHRQVAGPLVFWLKADR
jgi:hypothetical protein